MKKKIFTPLVLAVMLFSACDTTTDTIGSSLAEDRDGVEISTATFNVASRSLVADSVLSRNTTGYLGKVRDPETGAYITGDFMAQFNSLEGFTFPEQSSLRVINSKGDTIKGEVRADSCEIRLFYNKFYGDSLQVMKMTTYEMGQSMNENRKYYSNFSPLDNGYVRADGIRLDKAYTLVDFNTPEADRNESNYTPYITVKLNQPYTDKDGKTYNNFGTYIMEKYYDNPSNFKNSYTFRNNVVPGFFFKVKSGLGNMAYIVRSQLDVFFHHESADTTFEDVAVFWGTEEVLQTTTITNDEQTMTKLASDESCTYLKTPAGIFTELTLPVDEIMNGHEQDTITTAKIVLQRLNNKTTSRYAFDVPKQVLMIPEDSLHTFFENSDVYNNKNSFMASWAYNATQGNFNNSYTFNNISGMISSMYHNKNRSANWNKVVLVPVEVTTTSTSSGQTTITKVTNDMSLTSTRLVKGTQEDSPIQISVIYSRFK